MFFMKHLFYCLVTLVPAFLFAQQKVDTSIVEEPRYDTTSIEIESTNSFYFCSRLYKIPRDCEKEDQSNCCSFSSQVFLGYRSLSTGQFSCYDGTSLSWTYFETDDQAKSSFDGYPPQIKKQMKEFKQEKIKLFICDQEAIAYKLNYTTIDSYKLNEIIAYVKINGKHVSVHVHSQKELKSSKEMQPIFQQILRF
jgi:hypothetical protein